VYNRSLSSADFPTLAGGEPAEKKAQGNAWAGEKAPSSRVGRNSPQCVAMVMLPAPLLPATETVTGVWLPGATPLGIITFTW
jgi:hypothetical protein